MNAAEMTFGVELEVTLPAGTVSVGSYHNGVQIAGLPAGWVAKHDGSIRVRRRGYVAVEIVSPVLKGADGISQVVQVCRWLTDHDAAVNQSTGLHVHVGFNGTEEELKQIVAVVAQHEKAIYATTGTHARERGGFCQPIQGAITYQRKFRDGDQQTVHFSRYHLLNVTNVGMARKATVEFRAFAGTTNVTKVVGAIRLCLGLVEKAYALKRKAQWQAKTPVETSPIARGGEGQTALNRLFYWLGWTKGRTPTVYGDVTSESAPSLLKIKEQFMRLAKKYDGQ